MDKTAERVPSKIIASIAKEDHLGRLSTNLQLWQNIFLDIRSGKSTKRCESNANNRPLTSRRKILELKRWKCLTNASFLFTVVSNIMFYFCLLCTIVYLFYISFVYFIVLLIHFCILFHSCLYYFVYICIIIFISVFTIDNGFCIAPKYILFTTLFLI